MSLRFSLKKNIIAICCILATVVYITTIYSPCPEGKFIHSDDGLRKWCLAADNNGNITKHGPWVALHKDGTIKERGEFIYGQKDGHWVYWHENGHKKLEGEFKADRRDGKWSQWDSAGNKTTLVNSIN